MVPSYHLSIETPTPLLLGVGVMFALVTYCVFCAFESAAQWERFFFFFFFFWKSSCIA